MTMHREVAALMRIVPPPGEGHDERIDWAAAEADLGTPLPADYRDFMTAYGSGSIGELCILTPCRMATDAGYGVLMADFRQGFADLWDREGGVPGVTLGPDRVLPWGTGCNANELGWLMRGPDPDRWPVVVWRRHVSYGEDHWALFECGMAEFIRRLLLAEFDECPLSDLSLWGNVAPFVTYLEEDRSMRDPVTGEYRW